MKLSNLSRTQVIRIICIGFPCIFAITSFFLLFIAYGRGLQFNFMFLIMNVVIPTLASWRIEKCLLSNEKPFLKAFHFISLIIVFFIAFMILLAFTPIDIVNRYKGTEAEQEYTSAENLNYFMPEISHLGPYEEIDYYSIYQSALIFYWNTDTLICQYTPKEYEIQKAKLDETYVFQSKPIFDYYANDSYVPAVEIDGYQFRLLSCEKYNHQNNYYYPKFIMIIGFCDETKEIVYISNYDIDIDCITSLESFIIGNCGWNYIR